MLLRNTIPFVPTPTGNGVVDGTVDADLIDLGYTDVDGDMLTNNGSVADAGDGDDVVIGGNGDDTLWGAKGMTLSWAATATIS